MNATHWSGATIEGFDEVITGTWNDEVITGTRGQRHLVFKLLKPPHENLCVKNRICQLMKFSETPYIKMTTVGVDDCFNV